MAMSEKADKELDRSEALVLELLKIVDSLPRFTPLKGDICDSLKWLFKFIDVWVFYRLGKIVFFFHEKKLRYCWRSHARC